MLLVIIYLNHKIAVILYKSESILKKKIPYLISPNIKFYGIRKKDYLFNHKHFKWFDIKILLVYKYNYVLHKALESS